MAIHYLKTTSKNSTTVECNTNRRNIAGFEVFTVVVLKSIFFWDMTLCSALSGTRRFGGTYRLHLQGRRIVEQTSEQAGGKQNARPWEDRCIYREQRAGISSYCTVLDKGN
jgi:hypothetical protein